jgi:hypothetical protein
MRTGTGRAVGRHLFSLGRRRWDWTVTRPKSTGGWGPFVGFAENTAQHIRPGFWVVVGGCPTLLLFAILAITKEPLLLLGINLIPYFIVVVLLLF